MNAYIRVTVPATVANVGCGFDVLGFALEAPEDVITVGFNHENAVRIYNHTKFKLPLQPEQNCAGKAVISFLDKLGIQQGIDIHIEQKIRPGGGLGSSAASAVAAAIGVNKLFGNPLGNDALIHHCINGEAVASKAWHADNVAPALYGGFTLIKGYDPLEIIRLPVPAGLYCSVVYPQIKIETARARALLPEKVALEKAIFQWGNLAGFIAGLYTNDLDLIGRSVKDVIVGPQRSALIPGYHQVKQAALQADAMCCEISGSGPSMFAFSKSEEQAFAIAAAMQQTFQTNGLENEVYVSKIKLTQPKVELVKASLVNSKQHELL